MSSDVPPYGDDRRHAGERLEAARANLGLGLRTQPKSDVL